MGSKCRQMPWKLQKEKKNSQKAFPCSSPMATCKQAIWSGKNHPVAHPCTNHRLKENMKPPRHDWAKYSRKGELFPESRKIFFCRANIHRLKNMWLLVGNSGSRDDSQVPAPIHHKKTEVNIMNKACVQPFYWTLLMSTSQSWLALWNHGKLRIQRQVAT